MTLRGDVLLAILLIALASFVCRAGGYALLRNSSPLNVDGLKGFSVSWARTAVPR